MLNTKRKFYNERNFREIPKLKGLSNSIFNEIKIVVHVLPFRFNNFVIEELIDWNNIPEDPIFQLTFPQKEMLSKSHFQQVDEAMNNENIGHNEFYLIVNKTRAELNPHFGDQQILNVLTLNGISVEGMQHKSRKIVPFFPFQGQLCYRGSVRQFATKPRYVFFKIVCYVFYNAYFYMKKLFLFLVILNFANESTSVFY